MGDQEQINAGVGDAIIRLLLRAKLITGEDVLAVANEYDELPTRHDAEIHEGVAHSLRCALLEVDPPPRVDPAREMEAQYQRAQIRKRTAMIERQEQE